MTLTDTPEDLPDADPNEVPEPVAPVEVPEPGVEDTPERAEGIPLAKEIPPCPGFRPSVTG